MLKGITKHWLQTSLLFTFLLVVAAVGIYVYNNYNGYYRAVEQAMLSRISSMEGQLKITTGETEEQSSQRRAQLLRRMVEQFDEKERFEFMLLDRNGNILATSYGAMGQEPVQEELVQALQSSQGTAKRLFTGPTGEPQMAVTVLLPYVAQDIAALRMVTSLTLVDEVLSSHAIVAVAIGLVVLGFSIWSGVFFIRSIVQPLQQVEQVATNIARGDFSARLQEQGHADEIGRLCTTINQMAQELSKTEQMQNEFISSVSHELRTPLTSIQGWVETIAQIRDPEDEHYRKGLSIIGRETDRLYTMVEELLSFSRLQSGVALECSVLDLVAELTDAVLFVEPRARQAGLTLEYQEPETLLPVWADGNRLRQVFVNILDNAIKYSPAGSSILLDLLQDGENVYVVIEDKGQGIRPEDLENVKLKFFKGQGARRGSGIGLAIVDEVMRALDGSVDISSQFGQGTKVTLRLPLYQRGGANSDDERRMERSGQNETQPTNGTI